MTHDRPDFQGEPGEHVVEVVRGDLLVLVMVQGDGSVGEFGGAFAVLADDGYEAAQFPAVHLSAEFFAIAEDTGMTPPSSRRARLALGPGSPGLAPPGGAVGTSLSCHDAHSTGSIRLPSRLERRRKPA
ncbi:hypothetical protein [Streptomyces sp. CC224B]|uniref:hypothetical protein n=1 Tax=Streptomyces sp. CC224B TaxID=3044571 RepID=UPI0024A7EA74|nr:hypothetical protein [Streptomyces sp. CC224B]